MKENINDSLEEEDKPLSDLRLREILEEGHFYSYPGTTHFCFLNAPKNFIIKLSIPILDSDDAISMNSFENSSDGVMYTQAMNESEASASGSKDFAEECKTTDFKTPPSPTLHRKAKGY